MNLVRPYWPKYRLNPERPTVWFVGADDDDNIDKIELDLLPEGQPYMLPAWWTKRWGPFTKADANAVIDRYLADHRRSTHGFLEPIRRSESARETTPQPLQVPDYEPPEPPARPAPTPPPEIEPTAHTAIRRTLAQLAGRGLQWRCANEMGADVRSWTGSSALMTRVQGRHRFYGYRLHERITCVKIGRNTWLLNPQEGGIFAIQYHRTIIVLYHRDGRITLNTGGHSTPTTRQRLNDHIPSQWTIGTVRTPARMRGEDLVHTRSGFTGRVWPGSYWVVFFLDRHSRSPYAVYRDGITLPPLP